MSAITHDFDEDPFGDGYTKEVASKKVKNQNPETCTLGEECLNCGS